MTDLEHRILKSLLAKSPMTSKEMNAAMGTKRVLSRPLMALQLTGYVTQFAQRKGSLWGITEKGKKAALDPLPSETPKAEKVVKNEWEQLGTTAKPLLRELGGDPKRYVYKRRSKQPCLERPIQPVGWGPGLAELIKRGLVTRTHGDLRREVSHGSASAWFGEWGRFEINDEGRKVLKLAPAKGAARRS